jgi:LacI family transcriptional regulator
VNPVNRPFIPIAVLIQTGDAVGRRLHRGIFRYARPAKPWKIYTDNPDEEGVERTKETEPVGIIARIGNPAILPRLRAMKCPIVNVDDVTAGINLPHVGKDEEKIGQMAADHFLERGFRNFAFVGTTTPFRFAQRRERGFLERLASAKRACAIHRHEGGWPAFFSPRAFWIEQGQRMISWLRELPTPLALFAYTDVVGRWTIDLCAEAGIRVPDDVAILGAENDEFICQSAYPPLSAIIAPLTEVGYAAAQQLDRLMARRTMPRSVPPIYIAPHGVASRLSTDTLAVDDPEVAAALRIIRVNAGRLPDVKQLLNHLPISRRTLEKRFRNALGRTPRQEIERVGVHRASRLLAETDLSIKQIALDAGFPSAVRFGITFHRATGLTPTGYRSRHFAMVAQAPDAAQSRRQVDPLRHVVKTNGGKRV